MLQELPDPVKARAYTARYLEKKYIEKMNFKPVKERIVKKIIQRIEKYCSHWHWWDKCHTYQESFDCLVPFITKIINICITTSTYLDAFKARVIFSPVPKSGDPLVAKNWRPVVILNATAKRVERVLNHQLRNHHAYRSVKSMTTAWLTWSVWECKCWTCLLHSTWYQALAAQTVKNWT